MHCYRTDGVQGHAYARLNVHVHDRSDVRDALNTFLLCVADDVLEREGTNRALAFTLTNYLLSIPKITNSFMYVYSSCGRTGEG